MTEYECPNRKCRNPVPDYGQYCTDCVKKGFGSYENGKPVRE